MRKQLFMLILALVSGGQALADNAQRGKEHFAVCQTCHGENAQGTPAQGAPKLAGQDGEYLRRQLLNFRSGVRGAHEDDQYGQLMSNFAKSLPDDQAVRDVVAHIQTLKP